MLNSPCCVPRGGRSLLLLPYTAIIDPQCVSAALQPCAGVKNSAPMEPAGNEILVPALKNELREKVSESGSVLVLDVKHPYYCLPELNKVKRARRSRLLPRRGERQRRRPAWGPGPGMPPGRPLSCVFLHVRSFVLLFNQPAHPGAHRQVSSSTFCARISPVSWERAQEPEGETPAPAEHACPGRGSGPRSQHGGLVRR